MIVKTKEELEKELLEKGEKDFQILEEENILWVFTKNGVRKYMKPRPHKECIAILSAIIPENPMKGFLEVLNNPIKNKAYLTVQKFLKMEKTTLLLHGSAGAGKTVNSIYALYYLLRNRKIVKPLYLSVVTDIYDEKIHLQVIESDAFLIDDLNLFAGDYEIKKAIKIILYALERNYPLFITSNNTYGELETVFDQHIRSRLTSSGLIVHIKDKDYRVLKAKRR